MWENSNSILYVKFAHNGALLQPFNRKHNNPIPSRVADPERIFVQQVAGSGFVFNIRIRIPTLKMSSYLKQENFLKLNKTLFYFLFFFLGRTPSLQFKMGKDYTTIKNLIFLKMCQSEILNLRIWKCWIRIRK